MYAFPEWVHCAPKIVDKLCRTPRQLGRFDRADSDESSQGGASFVMDIWAHLDGQEKQVLERATQLGRSSLAGAKGPASVVTGTLLTVVADLPGFYIEDPVDDIIWLGEPANASFLIDAPPTIKLGSFHGQVRICVGGIPVAKLIVEVRVGQDPIAEVGSLHGHEQRLTRAFASYASPDCADVLARVQGMQKANPNLDVFLDVLSLRSGEDWERRLRSEIPTRDVFFLFWSRRAAGSEWVEREWRIALESKGLEYIDPVPLEDPISAPPPPELRSLHFNDCYLAFIKRARAMKACSEIIHPLPPPPCDIRDPHSTHRSKFGQGFLGTFG
jgi:hypothetical protein